VRAEGNNILKSGCAALNLSRVSETCGLALQLADTHSHCKPSYPSCSVSLLCVLHLVVRHAGAVDLPLACCRAGPSRLSQKKPVAHVYSCLRHILFHKNMLLKLAAHILYKESCRDAIYSLTYSVYQFIGSENISNSNVQKSQRRVSLT